MPAAERDNGPVADAELAGLFSRLKQFPRVVLAVSGGPDSTALLVLAQRWNAARMDGCELVAATVNHGLRPEAKREAAMVAQLASNIGVAHRVLAWRGKKPKTGLQEAAREARYRLLVGLARKLRAGAIVTAHTRDDQAETVLMRMARGSGLSGLAGIRPEGRRGGIALVRPLLDVPKVRLVATLRAAEIPFAEDGSNLDPKFTRIRVRRIAAALAEEGLDLSRLATLARRLARADDALEFAIDKLAPDLDAVPVELNAEALFHLPDEISLRLLGRALDRTGNEGPVELGKLETLFAALKAAHAASLPVRRTLAGALVNLAGGRLRVTRAPARRRS